ncbi:hypothetical protein, partial [Escherichia coli]|uniref:hypothetical protein n=1 Tax=Escherichia coli TaxID=562 RepID=UPI003CE487B2
MWIVPAPFCLGGKINDPKYVEGDKDRDAVEDGLKKRRTANVRVVRTPGTGRTPSQLKDNRLLSVQAIRDIEIGEELFTD